MRKFIVVICILFSSSINAFTDTIVLAEIAATLSADLAQTLKLLEIAQEQQEKLNKVHDNIQDRTMLANRVKRRIEQIQRLGELEIHDVRSLNNAISEMKYYYSDAKAISDKVARSFLVDESNIRKNDLKRDLVDDNERKDIKSMTYKSLSGSYEESGKNAAINTALTNEILIEILSTTRDIHDSIARRNNEGRIMEIKKNEERMEMEKALGIKKDQEYWSLRRGKL